MAAKYSMLDENGKVSRDKGIRQQKFLSTFSYNKEVFAVTEKIFDNRLPVLLKNFDTWLGEDKAKYLTNFSPTAWKSLSAAKRGLHTISNCNACAVNHLPMQSLFPLKSNQLKVNNPMSAYAKEVASLQKKTTKVVEPSKATIQDTARQIYFEPFKSLYNMNLAEALTKVPESDVTPSKTKVQKQKETRETLRSIKCRTEDQWSKVDCDTMLGTR